MATLAVTKMHGALNDFIVLDRRRSSDSLDYASMARPFCDRRSGIGADGLIVIESSDAADARMRIINADGSEAEMCGNGMRCVIRFLDEDAPREFFSVETIAGLIRAQVVSRGVAYSVRLDVGEPVFEKRTLPFDDADFLWVGNPHAVVFQNGNGGATIVELAAMLPDMNVHSVRARGGAIDVEHFERGVGPTMACGTGSVACAAASIRRGIAQSPVKVRVPGGELLVEWNGTGHAFLTGPAVRVFDAAIDS